MARDYLAGDVHEFAPDAVATIVALRAEGLSLRAIAARLNADRVPSARNRTWHAATVRVVLARTAAPQEPPQ